MESKHIVDIEEEDGPLHEEVFAEYRELDRLYISWAEQRANLLLLLAKQRSLPEVSASVCSEIETSRESVSTKFETFLTALGMQLPEISKMIHENQLRSMYLNIKGVDKVSLGKILSLAKQNKLYGTLMEDDQIEFVTNNRINNNEIKLQDFPDEDASQVERTELTKSESEVLASQVSGKKTKPKFYVTVGSKKISKNIVKSFKDVPDPVADVKIIEILPLKSAVKIRVEPPSSFGGPLVKYHIKLVIKSAEGTTTETEEQVEIISSSKGRATSPVKQDQYETEYQISAEGIAQALSATIQVFAENGSGRQGYSPYFRFRFCQQVSNTIRMLGRNELNQIDPKIVDDEAQKVIQANIDIPELEGYCDVWASVSFEKLGVEGLRPVAVSSRLTTLAIVNNAQLVQWGSSCTLVEGKVENVPASLFVRKGLLVQSVALGSSFCAALTISGQVFTWGTNNFGQLGRGHFSDAEVQPGRVNGLLENKAITEIAAGEDHLICLSEQGIAYTWGKRQAVAGEGVTNRFGDKIGLCNFTTHQASPQDISSAYIDKNEIVTQIATGDSTLGFITSSQKLYLWGENDNHILGLDYPAPHSAIPIRYPLNSNLHPVEIRIGLNHAALLASTSSTSDSPAVNQLLCWGSNELGQCGLGHQKSESITSPTPVTGLSGLHISFFSCGTDRTFVITDKPDRSTFVFGRKLKGLTVEDHYAPHKLSQVGKSIHEGYDTVVLSE